MVCSGLQWLKMHQRSCHIKSPVNEILETAKSFYPDTGQDTTGEDASDVSWNSLPNVKPKIILPKIDLQWQSANGYSKLQWPFWV